MSVFMTASESLRKGLEDRQQSLEGSMRELQASVTRQMGLFYQETRSLSEKLESRQRENSVEVGATLDKIRAENWKTLEKVTSSVSELKEAVEKGMEGLRQGNQEQLEKIRGTVEVKLQETLEERISASFEQVTKNLDALYKSLGEMNKLAGDVSSLNRMFSNVKVRGTWGEVQAGSILQDLLAPSQYVVNYSPRQGAVVEFAIRLPGKTEGQEVYLPIDSKFPSDTFLHYSEAVSSGDQGQADQALKALRQRVLAEARDIRDKYLVPPKTTDFAILFVPTESLYAELLRIDGFAAGLQSKYRVVLTGPTNFAALVNSLQLGFKTLQVEKNTQRVWKLFKDLKEQFQKFSEELSQSQSAIERASGKIGTAIKRTGMISSRLERIELPEDTVAETKYAEIASSIE